MGIDLKQDKKKPESFNLLEKNSFSVSDYAGLFCWFKLKLNMYQSDYKTVNTFCPAYVVFSVFFC